MNNENNRSFREKAGLFVRQKAMYLVLIGCMAVAGITAFVTFSAASDPKEEYAPVNRSSDQVLAEVVTPAPAVTPRPAATPAPTAAPVAESTAVQTVKPKQDDLLFAPVEGTVLVEYAVDSLLYSRTLKQWATHKGVDIAAPEGTPVRAVADGVVASVKNDPMLGYCLTLKHDEGMTSFYANLDDLPTLKEGATVKAGTRLGAVGKTAIAESADEAHLHFELAVDGKTVDPMDRLRGLVSIPVK